MAVWGLVLMIYLLLLLLLLAVLIASALVARCCKDELSGARAWSPFLISLSLLIATAVGFYRYQIWLQLLLLVVLFLMLVKLEPQRLYLRLAPTILFMVLFLEQQLGLAIVATLLVGGLATGYLYADAASWKAHLHRVLFAARPMMLFGVLLLVLGVLLGLPV